MEWSVIEQGQGAINMNARCRMRVHQLKMIKRSGCIYWSQVDYKLPAWCSPEKGKWNFKMHQEKCFDRSGQLFKDFSQNRLHGTHFIWKMSSDLNYPHQKKKKKQPLNSHQNKWGHKLQGWAGRPIANVTKDRTRTGLHGPTKQVRKWSTELWFRPSHSQASGSISHNCHTPAPW